MNKFKFLVLIILFKSSSLLSQVSIITDGSSRDSSGSAIFDVNSTSKGILIPRMNFEQRNGIQNPVEGLILYCTDCSVYGTGVLCIYQDSMWKIITLCNAPDSVLPGNHLSYQTQITWVWNHVPFTVGYKWNSVDNYGTAIDLDTATTKTETDLVCDSTYTRYVWSYNDCGYSKPATLTQSTLTCWTCGESLTIDHVIAGGVAPIDTTITYGTVTSIPGETTKCWITSNLGADHQATAKNDTTEASAGWYWQFNRMQGYKHSGLSRTPNTTWIYTISETSNWTAANDPCTLEIGNGWRVPTRVEWENVDAAGGWINTNGPWNSALKMHAAGRLVYSTGTLDSRGILGVYWSNTMTSTSTAWKLDFGAANCEVLSWNKAYGSSIRCIKD
jgi:hypothetical protein